MVSLSARAGAIALAFVGAAFMSGCSSCNGGSRDAPGKPAASGSAAAPPLPPPGRTIADIVASLAGCDIEHRGVLLDAGTDAMTGRFAWTGVAPLGVDSVEHDASTWARVSGRTMRLFFVLPEASPIFVSARSMGIASRAATVSLDDQPLGTLNFNRNQIRVASTGATTLPVDPGLHTLTFRFMGRARDADAYADLDWIRVGVPDENPATYGPPTLRDVVSPAAALSGVPHRSIALRGPGAVRCALRLPPGAHLRTAIGLQGAGEADASIRILRDGQKPVDVSAQHVIGGEKATWSEIDVPLAPHTGSLVHLELRAESTPQGARVLFGDPVITLPAPPPPATAKARAVVIVVLNGVEREELPPWHGAPTPHLPALSELALTGTTFHRHRAPTTYPAAVLGSMLTAMPPRGHTVTDPGARMPASQTMLGTIAHDASLRAAMFTGVPATFKSFGFGTGWEHFAEFPPQGNDLATTPIEAAATWMTNVLRQAPEARLLAVVHSRGGHPPWDVTAREQATLAPNNYTGVIDPRRGAQQIASARKRGKKDKDVFSAQDKERIRALETVALTGQDRAIGSLVSALKTAGIWESTVFVVTGDVGSGADALYAEGQELSEKLLTLPLYVRFPDARYGGANVHLPTEVWDITQTALSALGIAFSRPGLGRDLSGVASGLEDPYEEPQIATLDDRFSARWGELIMTGRYDAAPSLCDLELDPTCAFNRRETMPLAMQALFRRIVARDVATAAPASKREPATIEPETASSLRVWGAMD
ncbi:sulfatase-like hydrolase/transferase [Polyangium aurulentum]|uniref:sulfatase-like hydrolase/transferase n=1 Tax=Polyangium aurulentum TaxID=2567896 RepID=UPI001F1BF55F|nr:sulfatase-like hydrolase/transferase [Polyangium aurulentum]